MATLYSNLKFKPVVKDQLFYDQFEYCFSFTLAEANAMRGLSHKEIDARLDQRIEWRELARKRWRSTAEGTGWNEITTQIREDLHQVCDLILSANVAYKLIVSTHFGWIYTNDLALIDQLRQLRCLSSKSYSQAVINRPKNTVLLKNSRHQLRSYFYSIKLTTAEKQTIQGFFANQQEHIRTSPSFAIWLTESPYLRLQDYFFIDYSGAQWMTMLSLIRPGLIRKTQTIITK